MTRRPVAAALAVAALVATGCGSGKVPAGQTARLAQIRQAAAIYSTPASALVHGYFPGKKCIKSSDGSGSLGTPFLDIFALNNKQVNLLRPPELFYSIGKNNSGRLLGVGYYVPSTGQRPPSTPLGHMEGPLPGQGPGQKSHFELHAWVFQHNPDGVLNYWNKDVKCP